MQFVLHNKLLFFCIVLFAAIIAVLVANIVAVVYGGDSVAAPEIPREENIIGNGSELRYLILGDSTTIAQGGDYDQGYVVKTAENLSKNYKVVYQNYGVSGARINDVASDQIDLSKDFIPDVVLIAVGSNDVTHLTSLGSIKIDMQTIVNKLRERNKNAIIIFTGAASMGDVNRFIQPLSWFMDAQTKHVNSMFEMVSKEQNVAFAYIARDTGEDFARNPNLFAKDKFHPNNEGYAVWTKVLNKVIEQSLKQ